MIRTRLDAKQHAVTEIDPRYCNRRTVFHSEILPSRTVSRSNRVGGIYTDVTILATVFGRRVADSEQISA